jgi:hypothetical protein
MWIALLLLEWLAVWSNGWGDGGIDDWINGRLDIYTKVLIDKKLDE